MIEIWRRAMLAAGATLLAPPTFATPPEQDVFGFRLTAIEGGPLDLAQFRGRPMLVVNTASFCGFTPQYAGLQRLHNRLSPRGLVVLGVPSNDFQQESADAARIKAFCEASFGVEFPMAMPAQVRGPRAAPLFAWLAAHGGGPPRWNFHKYLVARDGRRVQGFATPVEPDAPVLLRAIEAALASPAA